MSRSRKQMKTAIELADEFPEQNLANIEPDAANLLNGWGIEAMTKLLQQALDALLPHGSSYGNGKRPVEDAAIERLKQALAQQEPNPWAEAVIDQLVTHFIYVKEHDKDPRKAVKDLLGISNSIALDPQVSSDAQALIDRGRREAQQEQPASVDAYVGAREDAAIWKKRALEAEELNRKFIAELNGPTYLGEPAQQEQPAQKPDLWKTQFLTDVMTSAGLLMHGRTDKKLAQRIADGSARWRTELYTHPAPTRPVLSDDEFIAAMDSNGIGPVDPDVAFAIKALVEAHCRGGADK